MRTTLDIADDVLLAVKNPARGPKPSTGDGIEARVSESFYGFEPFPLRGGVVSSELINKLRDEEVE